ncbi:MAG: secretin N-terminal domain-containing protein [Candidatus Sumerlaeaceae bacterium]
MFETREPRLGLAVLTICGFAIISNASASEETSDTEPAERAPSINSTKPGHISIVSMGFTIERVLGQFAEQGMKVRARGKVAGTKLGPFVVRNVPLRDALDELVRQGSDWMLYQPTDDPGTFEIWDQNSYNDQVLPTQVKFKIFQPKHMNADDATKSIWPALTPKISRATYDPRSNKLFVTDLPDALARIERLLAEMDVPLPTRVFTIAHADVNSVGEKLERMRSPAAPHPEIDERTRQVIVRDRQEKIREMELLVETLDIEAKTISKDTPLQSWKLTAIRDEAAVVEDYSDRSGRGKPVSRTLRKGRPEHLTLAGVETTVTLTELPDFHTSGTGAIALFRVDRAPVDVGLKLK